MVANLLSARSLAPNSSSVYLPEMADWLVMASSWAIVTTQPDIQPTLLPNARGAQVKLVPQSASAEFSSRNASATNITGTKANSTNDAAWKPVPAITSRP